MTPANCYFSHMIDDSERIESIFIENNIKQKHAIPILWRWSLCHYFQVQNNHFEEFFAPELDKHGYQALYKRRTTEVCLVLFSFAVKQQYDIGLNFLSIAVTGVRRNSSSNWWLCYFFPKGQIFACQKIWGGCLLVFC